MDISRIVIAILEYRIDLSRLEVIELDKSKKISDCNNIVKNREIRTPPSS